MVRFYIVRHGESEGNLKRICLGHTDLDLTDRGREQAKLTANALSDICFDKIYSSDLLRALNTAAPHAKMRNIAVIPTPEFRELYFGDWENRSVFDIEAEYGEMYTIGWRRDFGTFTAPSGEGVTNMAERAEMKLLDIAKENTGKTILITSHAALIRSLWGKISGFTFNEMGSKVPFPSNASYSIIDYNGEIFTPVSYSNDSHLGDLSTALPMK